METIGLVAAMPLESTALLRCIKGWKRIELGFYRGFRFQINDRSCVLITSGMGLSRAADATRTLHVKANPDLLISFGIAGAVKDDLNIGDVVVSGNTCLMDKGLLGKSHPLASMSREAWNTAAQVLQLHEVRLVSGTALTTRGSQVFPEECREIANPILEMETAGIAQVAAELKIPLLSIRSISDGPRFPIPFDLEAILDDKDDIHIGRLLMLVLHNPVIILQSRFIILNSKIAADHAAKVLLAALNQPSPLLAS